MKRKHAGLIAHFPLAVLIAACQAPSPFGTPSLTLQAINRADNAADINGVLNCYTEDATWVRPSGEVICGRAALREQYQSLFASSELNISIEIDEERSADSIAWLRGRVTGVVTSRTSDAQTQINDVFIAILHRLEPNEWKIRCLMWAHDTRSDSDHE